MHRGLTVLPVCADYTQSLKEAEILEDSSKKVVHLPGSIIGKILPHEAKTFLKQIRTLIEPEGLLIIGGDLDKDPSVIERAYNDAQGLVEQFHLSILHRLNRDIVAKFCPTQFQNRATYNRSFNRFELHLITKKPQTIHIEDP